MYGNRATRTKVYCGKVTNWFARIGVAEILLEAVSLSRGDTILVIGATTGVVEKTVDELRVNLKPVASAQKGEYCSVAFPPEVFTVNNTSSKASAPKLHRGDKVYIWKNEL